MPKAKVTHITLICGECGATATSKAKDGMIPLESLRGWEIMPNCLCPAHTKIADELFASRLGF